jgi:hypothetical protein
MQEAHLFPGLGYQDPLCMHTDPSHVPGEHKGNLTGAHSLEQGTLLKKFDDPFV